MAETFVMKCLPVDPEKERGARGGTVSGRISAFQEVWQYSA